MNTYFLFGKYSSESIKEISADRTEKAVSLIKELGGKVMGMYALLGGYDVVIIAQFATLQDAMKASLGLAILTGISFSTYPGVEVDDFDKMIGEIP